MLDVRYGPEACKICLEHRHGNISQPKQLVLLQDWEDQLQILQIKSVQIHNKSVTFSEDIGIFFHFRVCWYLWISIDFRFIPHQNLKKNTSASITFNWRTRGSNPSHSISFTTDPVSRLSCLRRVKNAVLYLAVVKPTCHVPSGDEPAKWIASY